MAAEDNVNTVFL